MTNIRFAHEHTHEYTEEYTHFNFRKYHQFNAKSSDEYIFRIKSAMSNMFAENNPKFSDSKQRDVRGNTEEGGPTLRLRLECSKAS